MEIITQIQAQLAGLRFYCTGKACKHGHIDRRYAISGKCVPCSLAIAKAQREGGYKGPVYNKISCYLSDKQRVFATSRALKLGCSLADYIRLLVEDDRFKHGK